MKIAVVGCGAVGSFYGARLCRAGQDVHFLLRSDYEIVRRHGVRIRSPEGDFNARPRCARSAGEIGESDLVVIALKTTANGEFSRLLPSLVGKQTAILTLQNGLGNEEKLAELFPVEQILGGMCFVCLNRIEPGVIQHLAHGRIVLGEFKRWPEPRTHDIASMFRHAGVNCKVADNLAQAHWEKLVWNIPFNGLGAAGARGCAVVAGRGSDDQDPKVAGACLTTDLLLADPRWETLVREVMLEVIHSGQALGYQLAESLVEKNIDRTRAMGAYKASTLLDLEAGRPLELEGLFLEPLRQAREAGVAVPRLEALCDFLSRRSASIAR